MSGHVVVVVVGVGEVMIGGMAFTWIAGRLVVVG
jgi:hypothetical protein